MNLSRKQVFWSSLFLVALFVFEVKAICGLVFSENSVSSEVEELANVDLESAKESIFQAEIILLKQKINDLQNENNSLRNQLGRIDELIQSNSPVIQGVNRSQLRDIIKNTLVYLGEKRPEKFTDLLMLTAQIESDLGHYYKQVRGPAVGVFQIEPTTEKSIWNDHLKYKKDLANKIKGLRTKEGIGCHELEWNVAYSSALAYTLYKWRGVNPENMNTVDMLNAYKKAFNTPKGKSTFDKSLKKIKGSKILASN